jgi:hypothetical protein
MLTIMKWGVVGVALLNLTALGALGVAYAWNDWLRPKLERRRARQRAFERLFTSPAFGGEAAMAAQPSSSSDSSLP